MLSIPCYQYVVADTLLLIRCCSYVVVGTLLPVRCCSYVIAGTLLQLRCCQYTIVDVHVYDLRRVAIRHNRCRAQEPTFSASIIKVHCSYFEVNN